MNVKNKILCLVFLCSFNYYKNVDSSLHSFCWWIKHRFIVGALPPISAESPLMAFTMGWPLTPESGWPADDQKAGKIKRKLWRLNEKTFKSLLIHWWNSSHLTGCECSQGRPDRPRPRCCRATGAACRSPPPGCCLDAAAPPSGGWLN